MISVLREFEWDMGHRVPNHDSLCKNPHGHRYKMVVEVSGEVDGTEGASSQGMVLDFGSLKMMVQNTLVDQYDHSFMYWSNDVVMRKVASDNPELRLISVPFVPTAECIVTAIAEKLQSVFQAQHSGLILESVVLFETPKCSARWARN